MFTSPPPEWVKECLKEWAEKQEEKEQVSRLGERLVTSKSNAPPERVCFYNEQEAQQPRTHKKPSPPEHVSFF